MVRYCPKKIKEKFRIYKNFEINDILLMFIGVVLALVILFIGGLQNFLILKVIIAVIIILISIILNVPIGDDNPLRLRKEIAYFFKYIFRKKKYSEFYLKKDLGMKIDDDNVCYNPAKKKYSTIVEVDASLIALKNEKEADAYIDRLEYALNQLDQYSIIKTEIALNVGEYYYNNIEKQKLLTLVQNDINLGKKAFAEKVFLKEEETLLKNFIAKKYYNPRYFIIIFGNKKEDLLDLTYDFIRTLQHANLSSRLCDETLIKKVYKYYYEGVLNEKDNDFIFNSWEEKATYINMNVGKDKNGQNIYHKFKVFGITRLPKKIPNIWLSELVNIEEVRLSMKIDNPLDSTKVRNSLSNSLMELRMQLNNPMKEYQKMEIEDQMDRITYLLNQLNDGDETIRKVYISFIVPIEKEKEFLSTAKKNNIGITRFFFRQAEAYMNSDLYKFLNLKPLKDADLDLPSSIISSSYPFTSAIFFDKNGSYIGTSFGYPVFFNPFVNIDTKSNLRVNANISITGTSGVGKSYLSKVLLLNATTVCDKIRILDPENEYKVFCENLYGKNIDVSGGKEVINPLEVFPSLSEDDESYNNDVTLHKQFLDEFFKTSIRKINQDDLLASYLNRAIDVLYSRWNIFDGIKLPEDSNSYPIMQDLYDVIKELYDNEMEKNNEYEAHFYKELLILLGSFVGSGLKAKLWNNHTTLKLDNQIVVFNFQNLLSSSNKDIAASQMLLIMKFLNQEIIVNRNVNENSNVDNKFIIMVDEAHNFISKDYPVALNFLYRMSKQIRKYYGSLIVTTQQIGDFLGGDDNTKKLAKGIIANCQYSFIFKNPNALDDVKNLYGEIMTFTDAEDDILTNADQGQCIFQLSPAVRTILNVHATMNSDRFFSDKDLHYQIESEEFKKEMHEEDVNSKIISNRPIETKKVFPKKNSPHFKH